MPAFEAIFKIEFAVVINRCCVQQNHEKLKPVYPSMRLNTKLSIYKLWSLLREAGRNSQLGQSCDVLSPAGLCLSWV